MLSWSVIYCNQCKKALWWGRKCLLCLGFAVLVIEYILLYFCTPRKTSVHFISFFSFFKNIMEQTFVDGFSLTSAHIVVLLFFLLCESLRTFHNTVLRHCLIGIKSICTVVCSHKHIIIVCRLVDLKWLLCRIYFLDFNWNCKTLVLLF